MGNGASTASKKPAKTVLDLWLDKYQEDVLEPDLEIVDPHHHLFDPANEKRGDLSRAAKVLQYVSFKLRPAIVGMMMPQAGIDAFGVKSPLGDKYLCETLQSDFGGHKVIKSVVIQSQYEDKSFGQGEEEFWQVTESELYYKASQSDPKGFPHACVGFVNLTLGEERVAKALEAHKAVNPNFCGVRHQLAWHKSPKFFSRETFGEMSRSANFRSGLAAVQKAGLSFDIFCYHTQLEEMAELIQAFPDLQFILDHIGSPLGTHEYSTEEGKKRRWEEWKQGMQKVAALPNVVVKLSGILMPLCGFGYEKRDKPPTSDEIVQDILPFLSMTLDLFGVDRCMFASNFPIDRVSTSYVVLYNAYKKSCDKMSLSHDDKVKLFRTNAERIYKLN